MTHHILLVDDDRWWGESYQKMLQDRGYTCLVALSVEAALAKLDERVPAAILLDFMLPDGNALQFLHELQSYDDTHGIPVVLLTGLSEAKGHESALESYGVRLVLDKATATPAQVIKAITEVIV